MSRCSKVNILFNVCESLVRQLLLPCAVVRLHVPCGKITKNKKKHTRMPNTEIKNTHIHTHKLDPYMDQRSTQIRMTSIIWANVLIISLLYSNNMHLSNYYM